MNSFVASSLGRSGASPRIYRQTSIVQRPILLFFLAAGAVMAFAAMRQASAACEQSYGWYHLPLTLPPGFDFLDGPVVYDKARHETVMFLDNVTLILSDGGWTERFPSHQPLYRNYHRMTYDEHRGVVVLFGGYNLFLDVPSLDDLWEWDGIDWHQVPTVGLKPAARRDFSMAYDSIRGVHVVFGGFTAVNKFGDGTELGDT